MRTGGRQSLHTERTQGIFFAKIGALNWPSKGCFDCVSDRDGRFLVLLNKKEEVLACALDYLSQVVYGNP